MLLHVSQHSGSLIKSVPHLALLLLEEVNARLIYRRWNLTSIVKFIASRLRTHESLLLHGKVILRLCLLRLIKLFRRDLRRHYLRHDLPIVHRIVLLRLLIDCFKLLLRHLPLLVNPRIIIS